jgi:hypothetical protein
MIFHIIPHLKKKHMFIHVSPLNVPFQTCHGLPQLASGAARITHLLIALELYPEMVKNQVP